MATQIFALGKISHFLHDMEGGVPNKDFDIKIATAESAKRLFKLYTKSCVLSMLDFSGRSLLDLASFFSHGFNSTVAVKIQALFCSDCRRNYGKLKYYAQGCGRDVW